MSAVCKAECGLFTGSLDPKAFGRMPGSSNTLDRLVCVVGGKAMCHAMATKPAICCRVHLHVHMCTPACILLCSAACAARWGAPSHPLHAAWVRGCVQCCMQQMSGTGNGRALHRRPLQHLPLLARNEALLLTLPASAIARPAARRGLKFPGK